MYKTILNRRLGLHSLKGFEIIIEKIIIIISIEEFNYDKKDLKNIKDIYIRNNNKDEKIFKLQIILTNNLALKEFFKTSFYKNEYFKTTLIFLNLIEKVKIKKI